MPIKRHANAHQRQAYLFSIGLAEKHEGWQTPFGLILVFLLPWLLALTLALATIVILGILWGLGLGFCLALLRWLFCARIWGWGWRWLVLCLLLLQDDQAIKASSHLQRLENTLSVCTAHGWLTQNAFSDLNIFLCCFDCSGACIRLWWGWPPHGLHCCFWGIVECQIADTGLLCHARPSWQTSLKLTKAF